MIYQLQFDMDKISEQIKKINYNHSKYPEYLEEIKNIADFGQFQTPVGELKLEKLLRIEEMFSNRKIFPAPVTEFHISVTLYCSKINGRIYDVKSGDFSAKDISGLIKRLKRKSGTRYLDQEIWESLCRVERSMVSNKMRFAIYERDGYRCCKCGASQDNARLEIDHIIPISKGGKSTVENLQTLCHRCNVEKNNYVYNYRR